MNFLEVIELRSADCHKMDLEPVLHALIEDVSGKAKEHRITVFSHMTIDTDFRIHLLHGSLEAQCERSALGLRIAALLKEYGLVNHSVWTEMATSKPFPVNT